MKLKSRKLILSSLLALAVAAVIVPGMSMKAYAADASHSHSYNYKVNGATITATCTASGCSLPGNKAELTLEAPSKIYDGEEVTPTLKPSAGWTTENGLPDHTKDSSVTFDYTRIREDGSTIEMLYVPFKVGDYQVRKELTLEGKTYTLKRNFSIFESPDEDIEADIRDVDFEYDGEPHGLGPEYYLHPDYAEIKYGTRAGTYDVDSYYDPRLEITEVKDSPRMIWYRITADGYNTLYGSALIEIRPVAVEKPTITLDQTSFVYDGSAKTPAVTVRDGDKVIPENQYTVSYFNNVNAGTATVAVESIPDANYRFSGRSEFAIGVRTVTDPAFAFDGSKPVYDGTEQKPGLTLYDGETVIPAEEYTVTYSNNINAGTATVTVTDKEGGNYAVSGSSTFEIAKAPITGVKLRRTILKYTGAELTAEIAAVNAGNLEVPADAYMVSGDRATAEGKHTVIVAARENSNYTGSAVAEYQIVRPGEELLTDVVLEGDVFVYTGMEIRPKVSVHVISGSEDKTLTEGTDYTLTYEKNINAGSAAKVRVDFIGAYKPAGATSPTTPRILSFTIGKAPLTVTARSKSIVYGDKPAGYDVSYEGLVNKETKAVLGGKLGFDCSYAQYGDIGSYDITPKGLTSGNYEISFVPGSLTVSPKEVGLSWTNTDLTYNGYPQKPDVTVTGMVNSDKIDAVVTGEQTDAGTGYTATASSLTGGKAANYKLPANNTTQFSIRKLKALVTEPAARKGLVEDAAAQRLINEGKAAVGCEMQYALGTDDKTAPAGGYAADVPTASDAGTYYVWYRIKADENYEVPEPACIVVSILTPIEKVTYDGLTKEEQAEADKLMEAHDADKDTAARILEMVHKRMGVSFNTMMLSDKVVGASAKNSDPAGTAFAELTMKAVKRTATTQTLQWDEVPEAVGYKVYSATCGKKLKLKKNYTKDTARSYKLTKLKKGKYYKSMVVAYTVIEGKYVPVAASVLSYCATKGKKYTNAGSLKVKKTKVTLKTGGTVKLKTTQVKQEKKKKIKAYRGIRYEALDRSTATVNRKTGVITGVGAGTTDVYVYAQNGVYKKVSVTVK